MGAHVPGKQETNNAPSTKCYKERLEINLTTNHGRPSSPTRKGPLEVESLGCFQRLGMKTCRE